VKLTRDHQLILGAAFIGCLGVFGMHVLLPALPAIGRQLQASAADTQLLITLSMLAIGLGNLVVAPISDRFGRRRVVLAAIGLYVAGSAAGLFAPTLATMIAARVLQAFGGGAAQAVVRAMLSDHFGPGAASAIAYTAMAVLVVPMFAPTLGGFAVEELGWRAPFGLAAAFGLLVWTFAMLRVAETHRITPEQRAARPRMLASYRQLLATPEYVGFVLYGGFMMSTVYTFIAGAPYVAIQVYGATPPEYGLWFAVPALASFVGFMLAGRVSRARGNYWMMRAGATVSLAGAAAILGCVLAGLWTPAALFVPAMLICHANALSAPNSTAAAIMVRPDIAGAASGLLGFLQLAISAAFAQGVAELENGTPWPLAIAIFVANALALVSYQWIRRHRDERIASAHDATVAAEAAKESSA
jgi:DHA1 family bicyclomycin/chloramphenicol resistance-like MFS transporter